MRACLDCLPCLTRNAIDLARKSAQGDSALEAEIARSGMEILGGAAAEGYPMPPPCYARRLIDNALAKCGGEVTDPWAPEKKKSTELALKLMERMDVFSHKEHKGNVEAQSEFEKRLRLAVAGNILDFSIYADLDISAAMEQMSAAKSILWIFDNCGEAVFDRPLMEPYRGKLTLAVRGKPAFNDMTRAELEESGYPDGFAAGGVVSNDDGVPGVVDATCGEEFRRAFASADLVVAKGQANFETMNERTDKQIAFLFLAKCPVVCRAIGAEPKTIQVRFSNPRQKGDGTCLGFCHAD